jgi:hypothetical protein
VGQVDKLLARNDTKGATELRLCLRSRDKTISDHRGRKHAQTTTGEPGMIHSSLRRQKLNQWLSSDNLAPSNRLSMSAAQPLATTGCARHGRC